MMRAKLFGFIILCVWAGAAMAQAAQTGTYVTAEPPPGWAQFVAQVEPAIMSFLGIVVTAGLSFLGLQLANLMNRQQADSQRAQIHIAAATGAGQVFAAAPATADMLTKQIALDSPEVQHVANWIKTSGSGDAVKSLGLTDADVAGKAQGAIGQLQAASAAAAPSSTIVAPSADPSTMNVSVEGNATLGKPKGLMP
jgi:Tfp pilus assembly protein PilV